MTKPAKLGSSSAAPWVFREVRQQRECAGLVRELKECLAALRSSCDCSRVMDTLLRAGELECALADKGCGHLDALYQLTDSLATLLLRRDSDSLRKVEGLAMKLGPFEEAGPVTTSPPEGFAFYALHPLDFADLVADFATAGLTVGVIGIRSIGTVLSAVAVAAFYAHGANATRITVRPTGHPFERITRLDEQQQKWLRNTQDRSGRFFVVDEGPGLSGSSFLSVGEALIACGVPADQIKFLGTRKVDPDSLCTPEGAQRWSRFRFSAATPRRYSNLIAGTDLSGGIWRRHLLPHTECWPACWPQMERFKLRSPERRLLFKFEGIGRWGEAAHHRASLLADAEYAPRTYGLQEGLLAYHFVNGRPATSRELTLPVIMRLAEYCAFRAKRFLNESTPDTYFEEMVRFNAEQEFGPVPQLPLSGLQKGRAICSDSRMHPHEWIVAENGRLLKTDAVSHSDDHFFPGPIDIAWDLAGAAVEWEMQAGSIEALVSQYWKLARDDVRPRLRQYIFAYSVFRMAYSKMAHSAVADKDEQLRFERDYSRYRSWAQSAMQVKRIDTNACSA